MRLYESRRSPDGNASHEQASGGRASPIRAGDIVTTRSVPLVPALRHWRREIRDSLRTTYSFDALWAAACEEATAVEWFNDALPAFAMRALERARFYQWAA